MFLIIVSPRPINGSKSVTLQKSNTHIASSFSVEKLIDNGQTNPAGSNPGTWNSSFSEVSSSFPVHY